MKVKYLDECPKGLRYFNDDDLESKLKPKDIEDIVEIFKTPLTGSYNWDYTEADNRIGIVGGVEGYQGDISTTYLVHWIGWIFPVPYRDWEIYKKQ